MKRGVHAVAAAIASLGAALVLSSSAAAAPTVDGEFDIPDGVGSNNWIVQGPDSNMWVTRENVSGVARITADGTVTPFPTTNTAFGIAVGPDDNLWVSTAIGVAKIDPATGAELDTYDIDLAEGRGIVAGPDGNMWVVGNGDNIGDGELTRFNPADPETGETTTQIPGASPRGLAVGSDGLLWIADASGRVLSATVADAPTITPYETKLNGQGGVQDVAGGPDGQIAYVNPQSDPQSVGRLTAGGTPQVTELEASDPFGVTFGQDGAYWIARSQTNDLLRMTPDGATTTLTGFEPSGGVGPRKIATGPNNTLWVTLDTPEKVARISGVEPGGNGGALNTKIDRKPKKKVRTRKRKAKVKFRFSASDPAATFECKLKRNKAKRKPKFKACNSPRSYKLKPGRYTFQVRAVAGGVVDDSPARAKFRVVRKK